MDNIPGELLDGAAHLGTSGMPAEFLAIVADTHAQRAEKLRSLRTRGWKSASDELDTVARHIREFGDALAAHINLHGVPGSRFDAIDWSTVKLDTEKPAPNPADGTLPGNTGRCASFRRATPDDAVVCQLDRGHEGSHAAHTDDGSVAWPRQHSGAVCGDVVILPDGTALNCQRPLGHDGDEHYDGRYRLWPRGAGTSRQTTVCDACNTDTHACPGCGAPLGHFTATCDECTAEANREIDDSGVTGLPLFVVESGAAEPADGVRVIRDAKLHSVSLVADPLPGQEVVSVTPVPEPGAADDYPGQCSSTFKWDAREDDDRCMLPGTHTGRHAGRKAHWDRAPETLGEVADAARAALIPSPRTPEQDTPAAVLVAETKEEVTATVAELTGDEPIGTVVSVGGIEFVKHSNNPFPPTVNDGSPLGNALSNPFAPKLSEGHDPLSILPPTPGEFPALSNPFAPPAPPAAPVALFLPPHLVPGAPKPHQSVSSIQTMSECGLRYRLQYRDGLDVRRTAWWNVGGTSFHKTVEHIERMHATSGGTLYPITEPVFETERDAAAVWHDTFATEVGKAELSSGTDSTTWQAAKGGKEGRAWWQASGEDMVRKYVHHRREFLKSWRLLTTPDGGLAQEVEFNALIDGVAMKGFIDSAWISLDGTTIRVEDYKSGSSSGDPFQLKTYGAALRAMGADTGPDGTRRLVGAFYDARKGGNAGILELTTGDDAEVSYRANTTATMDRAGIFPANPGNACKTCDVVASCPIMAMKREN